MALAAALLRKPGLLILDEATSGVEEAFAEKLTLQMKQLPQRPAVVVITHREAAMRCCDRVVVLERGQVVANGPMEELKSNCVALRMLLSQN